MLVAIMTRIRYLGGGFGRIPKIRLTYRFTKPRGFFSPDSSVSSACRVPMPPLPPPPIMPPTICLLRRVGSGSSGSLAMACRASCHCTSRDRYENPWQPALVKAAGADIRGNPGPPP